MAYPLRAMRIRTFFRYPSADLVTLCPVIDSPVDSILAALGVCPSRPVLRPTDPRRTIAVIGFPRSGNTYLTSWLQWLARPEITVLDGRLTHSALDLHRLAKDEVCVVVPIREPLATCASLLVRWDEHLELGTARAVLRAYRGWYVSARRTYMASRPGTIVLAGFEEFTTQPQCVTNWPCVWSMLDRSRLGTATEFEARLQVQLDQEEGQGLPLDGIPGNQMISLPDPKRAPLLGQASELLQRPELARHLARAERAYTRLATLAYPLSRTPSAMESPGK